MTGLPPIGVSHALKMTKSDSNETCFFKKPALYSGSWEHVCVQLSISPRTVGPKNPICEELLKQYQLAERIHLNSHNPHDYNVNAQIRREPHSSLTFETWKKGLKEPCDTQSLSADEKRCVMLHPCTQRGNGAEIQVACI